MSGDSSGSAANQTPSRVRTAPGNGVQPCGPNLYCCYGFLGCDCNNSTVVFSLPPVRIVATIPTDAAKLATQTTSTSSPPPTGTTTSTTSSVGPTQTNTTNANSNGSAIAVGLGVGLGVGLPLTALVLAVVWYMRKRQARTQEHQHGWEPHHGAGAGGVEPMVGGVVGYSPNSSVTPAGSKYSINGPPQPQFVQGNYELPVYQNPPQELGGQPVQR